MDECIVCGVNALYICKPCKGSFCEEHKGLHEKNKNKAHVFEEIGVNLDYRQTKIIAENLSLKIKKVKEFREKIILETRNLIQKIEELCTNCLKSVEARIQSYMILLQIIQRPITRQDLKIIEDQSKLLLSFTIPIPNFKDIKDFYDFQFFQEFPEHFT